MSRIGWLTRIAVAALFIALAACSDNGTGGSVDGDEDWGFAEWEKESEHAVDGDGTVDGDADLVDMGEWDHIDIPPYDGPTANDEPFIQWQAESFYDLEDANVPQGVHAIEADPDGGVFIGADNGLFHYDAADGLRRIENPPEVGAGRFEVKDLELGSSGELYLLADTDLPNAFLYSLWLERIELEENCQLTQFPTALALRNGVLYIGTSGGVSYYATSCLEHDPFSSGYPDGYIVDLTGTTEGGIAVIKYDELHVLDALWLHFNVSGEEEEFDPGLMDGRLTSVSFYMGGAPARRELWLSSTVGMQMLSSNYSFTTYAAAPGQLPWGDIRQAAVAPDGAVWAVINRPETPEEGAELGLGVLRYDPAAGDRWRVFHSRRYLPDDEVTALGFDSEGAAVLGHPHGFTRLWPRQVTLASKAEELLQVQRLRHQRLGGYTAPCAMAAAGQTDGCVTAIRPDEALWTGMTALAETFRAAVLDSTGGSAAAEARAAADSLVNLMLELGLATQVDGLPAAALLPRGEGPVDDPDQGEWNRSNTFDWLGNPSAESLLGHVMLYPFYADLLADSRQKRDVGDVIGKIARHVIAADWRMLDLDGAPTDAGLWQDTDVTGELGQLGLGGVKALELLSLLRAAYAAIGDGSIWEAYTDRAYTAGYAEATRHQKTMSYTRRVDYAADLRAFLGYLVLLRLEDVPEFRAIYLASLEEAYGYAKNDGVALYDMIHARFSGQEASLTAALRHLREAPDNLVDWRVDTCWRKDATLAEQTRPEDPPQLTEALPAGERRFTRPGDNTYVCDWGATGSGDVGGLVEYDAAAYLLTYWMARHYGMLAAPEETAAR